jgi:hypothetical protein
MSIILKKLDKNYYKFYCKTMHIDDKIIEDTLFYKWIDFYKLEEKELDIALEEMILKKHNIAHFGITGAFIYTEYKE